MVSREEQGPVKTTETIYITFDVDWAHDSILRWCIDLCRQQGVRATYYVTHETDCLDLVRNDPQFELGIHPDFNPMLERTNGSKTVLSVLSELKEIVPTATSIRSHGIVQSARLLDAFLDNGITHDSNTWIPHWSEIEIKAWKDWNGLVMVPFFGPMTYIA